MRIRKRQVPFPLSSLSPIPLSDLHLNPSHPPVQHHHHHHHHDHVHPQPSDQTNQRPSLPIGNSRLDDFSAPHDDDDDDGPQHDVDEKNKACLELMMMSKHEAEDKREIIGEEKKSNDTNILGAQNSTVVLPMSSTTSSPQVGRWCEGERAFPLKKRRGSFGTRSSNKDSLLMEKEKEKVVMKTKVNKKCVQQNDSEKSEEIRETNDGGNDDSSKNNGAKKKGIVRGGAIMEGSRCSRVNGRGWRCCQQTLVGYSLCEHHLGKGRLRSMTSVRTRAIATATTASTTIAPLNKNIGAIEKVPSTLKLLNNDDYNQDDDDDEEEEEEEKKPLMMTKKRMKLGMVKARSLSSLLGQTDNAVISVAVNNKNNND